jgi:hypothetical protein
LQQGLASVRAGVVAVGWRLAVVGPAIWSNRGFAAVAGRTRKDVSTAETITWINETLDRSVEGGK